LFNHTPLSINYLSENHFITLKILITGGNSARALKLLKAFPAHFILFADYGDVPAIFTEKYALTSLGVLNKDSIAHILLNFCITESIDCIIPLNAFEAEPIAKSAVLFKEYNIEVLLPQADVLWEYIGEKLGDHSDFAVFIHGECIFSTSKKWPQEKTDHLNGVYTFNETDIKLFTV